jgi:hypothetical protein
MPARARAATSGDVDLIRWVARIGAVTGEALARRDGCSVPSARGRLVAGARAGLLCSHRPLARQPALFALTRQGSRFCGLPGVTPARVSPATAVHAIACASVAATLERAYPDHRLVGERELLGAAGDQAATLAGDASRAVARIGGVGHRPDLVLLPDASSTELPTAVEVELTAKSPSRLQAICRAWARARCVAGVLYVVAPEAQSPVSRAVAAAGAQQWISVVPLDAPAGALPRAREPSQAAPTVQCGGSTS